MDDLDLLIALIFGYIGAMIFMMIIYCLVWSKGGSIGI